MKKQNKQKILRISLSIAITGILTLLILTSLEPSISKINQIKNKSGEVRIKGEVVNKKRVEQDFYILTVKDNTGQVEVLLNKNLTVNKVEVLGRISKYKNKTQIQASKIKPI